MTKPLILVTGATGKTGSAVVEQLSHGIGLALASEFARSGHGLGLGARKEVELERAGSGSSGVRVGVIDTHHAAFSKSQRPNNHGNGARASQEVHRA